VQNARANARAKQQESLAQICAKDSSGILGANLRQAFPEIPGANLRLESSRDLRRKGAPRTLAQICAKDFPRILGENLFQESLAQI